MDGFCRGCRVAEAAQILKQDHDRNKKDYIDSLLHPVPGYHEKCDSEHHNLSGFSHRIGQIAAEKFPVCQLYDGNYQTDGQHEAHEKHKALFMERSLAVKMLVLQIFVQPGQSGFCFFVESGNQ